MKKKALVASILTIALCLSLIAGSTFALFTSESTVNVAVTSGKVNVVATIAEQGELQSTLGEPLHESTVTYGDGTVTLDKIVPGDFVEFSIAVENHSDVAIKYRTVLKAVEDNGLWDGLEVTATIGEDAVQLGYGNWTEMAPAAEDGDNRIHIVNVKVSLPETAGNEYQGKSCTFAYTVEAVQGNAETIDAWDGVSTTAVTPVDGVYEIGTAAEFAWFMQSTQAPSNNNYGNYTVKLTKDIDLGGYAITGVANDGNYFGGNFDGNGKTISNFVINMPDAQLVGLFRHTSNYADYSTTGAISNLTVKNATIIGKKSVGAIAGGALNITNCKVEDCTVVATAKRVGGIVGLCNGTMTDCTISNSNLYNAYTDTDAEQAIVAALAGFEQPSYIDGGNNTIGENVNYYLNTVLVANATELKNALDNPGNAGGAAAKVVYLVADIDMTGWTAINGGSNHPGATIEGNGHALKNQTAPLFSTVPARRYSFKNIVIDNANLDTMTSDLTNQGYGAFIGAVNNNGGGNMIVFENCTVKNSSIKAFKYAGAFVGMAASNSGAVTFTNCKVIDTTVATVDSSCGGFIGHTYSQTTLAGCSVEGNSSVSCAENRGGDKAKAGWLVGTVNAGTTTISDCTVTAPAANLGNVNAQAPVVEGFVGRDLT